MSRFGPNPHAFFQTVYSATAPWDIGAPQPDLMRLLSDFPPEDPIVDLGCGAGDHAIALATQGHQVLGVDFVDTAIALARSRAATLPTDVAQRVEFRVADGLRPSQLGITPRTFIDSGFLHLFDNTTIETFVAELASTLPTGGRYYLLAFATEFDIPHGPRKVAEADIRTLFSADRGWRILSLKSAEFLNRVGPPVPATCACIERL